MKTFPPYELARKLMRENPERLRRWRLGRASWPQMDRLAARLDAQRQVVPLGTLGRAAQLGMDRGFIELGALELVASGAFGMAVGVKLNSAYPQVTPLKLYPSTVGAIVSGVVAAVTLKAGFRQTSRAAVAGVAGLGIVTLAEYAPVRGGLLRKRAA